MKQRVGVIVGILAAFLIGAFAVAGPAQAADAGAVKLQKQVKKANKKAKKVCKKVKKAKRGKAKAKAKKLCKSAKKNATRLKKKLKKKGSAKVKVKVTNTPTGGKALAKSKTVKLLGKKAKKKKRRH